MREGEVEEAHLSVKCLEKVRRESKAVEGLRPQNLSVSHANIMLNPQSRQIVFMIRKVRAYRSDVVYKFFLLYTVGMVLILIKLFLSL